MPVENQIQQMMAQLGRALSNAARTSPEIGEALRRIREQGFVPQLILSCVQEDSEKVGRVGLRSRSLPASLGTAIELTDEAQAEPVSTARAEFRLDSRDVAMLQSLGIDPTRSGRRRKRHGR